MSLFRKIVIFKMGFLIVPKLTNWARLPSQWAKRSSCLHLTGFTDMYNHEQYFYLGFNGQTQDLQCLEDTHLPTDPPPPQS